MCRTAARDLLPPIQEKKDLFFCLKRFLDGKLVACYVSYLLCRPILLAVDSLAVGRVTVFLAGALSHGRASKLPSPPRGRQGRAAQTLHSCSAESQYFQASAAVKWLIAHGIPCSWEGNTTTLRGVGWLAA